MGIDRVTRSGQLLAAVFAILLLFGAGAKADPATFEEIVAISQQARQAGQEGRLSEALELAIRAYDEGFKIIKETDPYAYILNQDLGRALRALGRFDDAEPHLGQALAIANRYFEPSAKTPILAQGNYAQLLQDMGRIDEAETLYREALEHARSSLKARAETAPTIANNLATLLTLTGRPDEAEPLIREAYEIVEESQGSDSPDAILLLGNLAGLEVRAGRFAQAERHYRDVLARQRALIGDRHPTVADTRLSLGALLAAAGRYEEAETLFRRAAETSDAVLGERHPGTLSAYESLANLMSQTGRLEEAETLYRDTLRIRREILPANHIDTIATVEALAATLYLRGQHGEAERLYREVLATPLASLSETHRIRLNAMTGVAFTLRGTGRDAEAERLLRDELKLRRAVHGPSHPETLTATFNLVIQLMSAGESDEAVELLAAVKDSALGWTAAQLAETSQIQVRRHTLARALSFQTAAFSVAVAHPTPESRRLAAEAAISWKTIDGEADAVVAQFIANAADPEVAAAAKALDRARAELTAALARDAEEVAARQIALTKAETRMAALSSEYEAAERQRRAGLYAVSSVLENDEALIEFRAYIPSDFETAGIRQPRLLAILIRRNAPPQLADLGLASEFVKRTAGLVGVVAGDRGLVATNADDTSRKHASLEDGRWLANRLLAPFDDALRNARTVYLSPDGPLHGLPFELLPFGGAEHWIEVQDIRMVSTGRALARKRDARTGDLFLALGAADFDAAGGARSPESRRATAARSLDSGKATRESGLGRFAALPETGPEVADIAELWRQSTGGASEVLTGAAAGETALKTLAAPPRVLHIASHGFYLSDDARAEVDPMALGGLALAGANRGLAGETAPDEEDGVLWALEAMGLRLSGTELVALSACDTAKGELDISEGVYGLGRAFQIAGAENVLLTLWALNDQRAREFMTDFYRAWLSGAHDDPAEALRAVKLDWIRSGSPAKADPRAWAPYVLVQNGR